MDTIVLKARIEMERAREEYFHYLRVGACNSEVIDHLRIQLMRAIQRYQDAKFYCATRGIKYIESADLTK